MDKKIKHIIFIDDDMIIGMVSKKLLEHMQIAEEVFVFSDSFNALQHLKERYHVARERQQTETADLILLDLDMPGLGGFEILKVLQELNEQEQLNLQNVYFSIATSHSTEKEVQKAKQYGVLGILEKPLKQQEMLALISKIP